MNRDNHIEEILETIGAESLPPDVQAIAEQIASDSEKIPTSTSARSASLGRTIMRNPFVKLAVAAAIVVAVVIGLKLTGGSSVAFADVVKEIGAFRPYSCTTTVEDKAQSPQSYRLEQLSLTRRREVYPSGEIRVFDLAASRMLILSPRLRQALEQTMNIGPTGDFNLMNLVAAMQDNPPSRLGAQQMEGHKVEGFRSINSTNDITVWVNVQTKLPVSFEVTHVSSGRKIAMTDFQFDVAFDESLFSTTAPEGYAAERVGRGERTELQKFMDQTTEQDLLDGLRAVATFLGGEFPSDIELTKLQDALRTYVRDHKLSDTETRDRLAPVSEAWTKAHWYVQKLKGDTKVRDFTYTGSGVKLGDAAGAILRWRPAENDAWHVIYGDLSVKDVSATNPPK